MINVNPCLLNKLFFSLRSFLSCWLFFVKWFFLAILNDFPKAHHLPFLNATTLFRNFSSLFSECGDNFSRFFIDVFEVLRWFPLVFYSCFRRFASLWLIFLLRFSRKCVHNSMFFARSFRSFASILFYLSHFWGEFRLLGIMKAVIKAADLRAERE